MALMGNEVTQIYLGLDLDEYCFYEPSGGGGSPATLDPHSIVYIDMDIEYQSKKYDG